MIKRRLATLKNIVLFLGCNSVLLTFIIKMYTLSVSPKPIRSALHNKINSRNSERYEEGFLCWINTCHAGKIFSATGAVTNFVFWMKICHPSSVWTKPLAITCNLVKLRLKFFDAVSSITFLNRTVALLSNYSFPCITKSLLKLLGNSVHLIVFHCNGLLK